MLKTTLLESVYEEVEKETLEILKETSNSILVYDYDFGKEINFEFNLKQCELRNKIYCNKKFLYRYNFDLNKFCNNLFKSLDKEAFQTLNYIFFIYKKSDIKYVFKKLNYDKHETLSFDFDNFFADFIGQLWFEKNCIFINLSKIEKFSKKFALYNLEYIETIIQSIYETTFHEMRHLWLDTNIFISEENIPLIEQSEEYVENFARALFQKNEDTIINSHKKNFLKQAQF